jgi:hypothetical protein
MSYEYTVELLRDALSTSEMALLGLRNLYGAEAIHDEESDKIAAACTSLVNASADLLMPMRNDATDLPIIVHGVMENGSCICAIQCSRGGGPLQATNRVRRRNA